MVNIHTHQKQQMTVVCEIEKHPHIVNNFLLRGLSRQANLNHIWLFFKLDIVVVRVDGRNMRIKNIK